MKERKKIVVNGLRVYQLRIEAGLALEQAARKAEIAMGSLVKIQIFGINCEVQQSPGAGGTLYGDHVERQALKLAAAFGVPIEALADPATVTHDGRELFGDAGLLSEEESAILDQRTRRGRGERTRGEDEERTRREDEVTLYRTANSCSLSG